MSGNSNTVIDEIVLTPGGVFDTNHLPPTVNIPAGEQGAQGPIGPQGASVDGVDLNQSGDQITLSFSLNDTDDTTLTAPAFTLPPGTQGQAGASITNITLNDLGGGDYSFTVILSSGDPITTDVFSTAKGDTGDDGASAYQIAMSAAGGGFVGTEAEWITSLHGQDGQQGQTGGTGQTGAPGASITNIVLNDLGNGNYDFTVTLSNGASITTADFTTAKGDDGDSAYQVALDNGFVGNEAAWLASLVGEAGSLIETVAVDESSPGSGNYSITLGLSEGDDVTSDPFTLAINESLGSLTDVSLTTPIAGQGLTYNGSEWINAQSSHITLHDDIPAGNQQQLQSLVETTYLADGSQTSVVWVFDAIMPVTPGDPTASFSALPTQYGFDDGDTITLTLTADSTTNSYFSVSAGNEVTTVISVSGVGANDSVWSGTVTSAQPSLGDTDVTELVVTLTSQTGGNQIAGNFTVNMEVVVDNPTTHPSNVLTRGYPFTIAAATATTMDAAYTATTYRFDGDDHDAQTGTATLTASNGIFVGVPTIAATAPSPSGSLTLGTVTVNAANTIATVPYTITEPDPLDEVSSTLTWEATAQPVGATGANGETDTISNGIQVINIFGEPALVPSASGTPPAVTSYSAFAIPTPILFGIDSSSDLSATGHYSYIEEDGGAYPSSGITELTGTNSATHTIQIPGTTAFENPHDSGYERRGIQIGWSDGSSYTVVDNLEDVQLETYHPILLWYNQNVTTPSEVEALYPAVTMAATEVIIPSTSDIITGHVFTPTSGNFVMLLIPDTWQTVTSVNIVGDGNDQPVGVTVLPAGQITGIADSFSTSVLYQAFYVAGASPNVRLRIDSIS